MLQGRRPTIALLALVALAVGGFFVLRGGGRPDAVASACPEGYRTLSEEYVRELRAGAKAQNGAVEAEGGEEREPEAAEGEPAPARGRDGRAICLRADMRKPEPFADLATVNRSSEVRLGTDRPKSLARAIRAKQRASDSTVPGTAGTWTPIGKGPLRGDDPDFPSGSGTGFVNLAGRITDFAYDPQGKQLFTAVSSGGIWRSTDLGGHWTSIGDNLPTQTTGAVGWTPAGGGTVISLTGDNAFGGTTFAGAGAYWSDDLGKTWTKAKGLPDGAMGFRLAVHPDKPEVVYAATGVGLYRSTDAGRSFENVRLPVGDCAGDSFKRGCFLASVVTDVVVRGKDRFGHGGGAVLAAVGWRAANRKSPDGSVQAPANGVYSSSTGEPGSFKKVGSGFPSPTRTGRVSLGIASGPDQNHNYVYALVQDAVLFNTGKILGLDVPSPPDPLGLGLDPTATPTYLNGVYVTGDFGQSWTRMALGEQFLLPTNFSSLAPLSVLGFGPGIQAWYNSWIEPDPSTQSGGVPTRLTLGLEEIFESRTAGLPQNGLTDFQAVGPYNATGGVCLLVLAGDICSEKQNATPDQTTTHPDQHGAIYVPTANGSTLVVGNDGGAYTQKVPSTGLLTPAGFGKGADEGFNTLLPYGVARAKDGTTYAGLQDNGTIKVTPDGRQVEMYGGDGTYVLTDPDDSNHVLGATPNGALNLSHDGGRTWANAEPSNLRNGAFLTPFVMDPTDRKRLGVAGRNIYLADSGLAELDTGKWSEAYDLGTQKKPGVADAEPTADDPPNVANAMDLRGKVAYVGFCGSCDPVKDNLRFKGGIATNASGRWRIVAAKGLPQRIINSVRIDPGDTKTVYVALGSSTARPYAPAQALGDDGTDANGGFVYRSTDGGETFTDITGNLPRIGATWLLVRGGQLVVATTVGVFASRDTNGGEYGLLGDDLPAAPVFSMQLDPADSNRLIAASLGRGLWAYDFKDPPPVAATCADRATPTAKLNRTAARAAAKAGRKLRLRGTASDRGCKKKAGKLTRVSVSVAKLAGKRCRYLRANGRFTNAASCSRPKFIRARGTKRWTFTSKRALPKGHYRIRVRALDAAGNVDRSALARRGVTIRLR